ncbi:MAG: Holliday junction branch migration DNA helicase RuvB [Planctomycetes bacterium]|nr:Holliday junction branch migration DNA helicase RuvB [Planctomycetota bacterium]
MAGPAQEKRVFDPVGEDELDRTLRPRTFGDFVGQARVVGNLRIHLDASRGRGEPPDHVLLTGLPGLGKTTLAHLLATESGSALRLTTGPALERPRDLVGILSNLQPGDILFVDEIHRIPAAVEEILYPAMEDFRVDLTIDQGPNARVLNMRLARFALVGATTREGLLSSPLRSRFGLLERLDPYPPGEIAEIVRRAASRLGVSLETEAVDRLASRARGIPRIGIRLLKRVRDLAQVRGAGRVDAALAEEALRMLGVDEAGLEELDRRILGTILRLGGGPVGLKTIAMAVGEEADTIESVYEPFLVREGYLQKSPRGRSATSLARRALRAARGVEPTLF